MMQMCMLLLGLMPVLAQVDTEGPVDFHRNPFPPQGGERTADLIEVLLERMALPLSGRYTCESVIERLAVHPEERARALEHLRFLASEYGWSAETDRGRGWLRSLRHRSEPGWMPGVIGWMAEESSLMRRSQPYEAADGRRRIVTRWLPVEGQEHLADRQAIESVHWLVLRGEEMARWSSGESFGRTATRRDRIKTPAGGTDGDWYSLILAAGRIEETSNLARELGSFEILDGMVRWALDLTVAEVELRLERIDLPCWIGQLPCQMTAELAGSEESGFVLTTEWTDPDGGPLVSERLEWAPGARLPTMWREACFIPGSKRLCALRERRFAELGPIPEDSDPIAWIPQPGERVLDYRFGPRVDYEAGPEGTLPDDQWISAKAASYGTRNSPVVLTEPIEATLEFDATGPAKGATFELELGEHPVGIGVQIEVKIRNVGPGRLALGPVLPECGCTGVRLSTRELRPGGSATLRATQEIETTGTQRSRIVIGTDAGEDHDLRIELSYTGVPR